MTAPAPSPRIAALTPPFAPELDAMLKKWMPPGSAVPPLALFRTLAVHPELSSRMRPLGAALLGHGLLTPRERELVIQRTCARARRDPRRAQIRQPLAQHARRHALAARLQPAKRRRRLAQLPQHAQGPAPPQQIEQRHDGPASARSTRRLAGAWSLRRSCGFGWSP